MTVQLDYLDLKLQCIGQKVGLGPLPPVPPSPLPMTDRI